MGLFSYLRRKFSKNIELGGDISDHLVFVYKLKKGKFWLGNQITVPKDFCFVIGKAGKVLDVIPQGRHELTGVNLPKSVKRFSLSKQLKDGSFPKSFEADAYFVNIKLFELEKWKAYRKIELFDERFGYFNIKLSGAFAYKVSSAEIFLKQLFKVYDFLRQNEAEEILKGFVSEFIIEEIEKSKFDYQMVSDREKLTDSLFEILSNKFNQFGVEILGFEVEKIKFSKSFEKRVQAQLFEENLEKELSSEIKNEPVKEFISKPKTKQKEKAYIEEDFIEESFVTSDNKDEFVDLNNPLTYNKADESVRCKFCGAKNSKTQETCQLCGESLMKRKF